MYIPTFKYKYLFSVVAIIKIIDVAENIPRESTNFSLTFDYYILSRAKNLLV